ncbi:hypothetical protein GCM10029992_17670 [Glycomyces albus]
MCADDRHRPFLARPARLLPPRQGRHRPARDRGGGPGRPRTARRGPDRPLVLHPLLGRRTAPANPPRRQGQEAARPGRGVDARGDGGGPERRAGPELDPVEFYRQFSIPADQAAALEWNADGLVVETEYRPETDRYGGPAGIGPSEHLFNVSSELAAVVIARTAAERTRTGAALDLLLGFVSAMYETASESVGWLRQYATMWRYLDRAVAETFARTRAAAEATVAAGGTGMRRRRAAMRDAAPAAYRRWWDEVGATAARLRELHEAGELVGDPDAVMVSHLHMLYNRLGLTASDEVYLAWMASLLIASPGEGADYFADGPDAADRAYHELSKFRPATMDSQQPRPGEAIVRPLDFASDEPLALPQTDPSLAAAPGRGDRRPPQRPLRPERTP